jgi:hypothetical protein
MFQSFFKQAIVSSALFLLVSAVSAQDTIRPILNIKGAVSLTNNGFSFIPSFSLGKPATILNLNINGGKRFSFEPEFRFSITDAKPWSFIFIWRYKVINKPKFQLTAGTHLPAIPFRTVKYRNTYDIEHETLASYRFLPFELTPQWNIKKNVNISVFYLHSWGFGDATRTTNFASLRGNFTHIPLSDKYFLRWSPQFFYLQLDDKDGFYVASNLTLAKKNSPFSLTTMLNKPLKTDIGGKVFDWNISVNYAFGKSYIAQ